MRSDRSPYEGVLDDKLAGQTCFGRVVSVDGKQRRCRVKTLGRPNITDDLDLTNVQWINLSSSADGDEETTLPRIGSYGVIIFINSEPYILGFYKPIPATGSEEPVENEPLLPGDKIIKTVAGNRVILRSGGSVEIESTKLCRVYFIPSRNLMTMICQEMELSTDGGYMNWTRDRQNGDTQLEILAFDNLQPTHAILTQMGKGDGGEAFHMKVGNYSAGTLSKVNLEIKIQPTGNTEIVVGDKKFTVKIDASAGKIAIGISGKELLKQVVESFTQLGSVKPLSPLGPCAPLMATPDWTAVKAEFDKIKDITGDL